MELQTQFHLQEIARRSKQTPGELAGAELRARPAEETSALLMNMLKDPAVTVGFLKNIFAMQEVIRLLPANNSPFTEEMEKLFDQLMVKPESIGAQLRRQELDTTAFKGELFDFLRDAMAQYPEQRELHSAVLGFLKALTLSTCQEEILGAVAYDLQFLAGAVEPSKALSAALTELSRQFLAPQAQQRFPNSSAKCFGSLRSYRKAFCIPPGWKR